MLLLFCPIVLCSILLFLVLFLSVAVSKNIRSTTTITQSISLTSSHHNPTLRRTSPASCYYPQRFSQVESGLYRSYSGYPCFPSYKSTQHIPRSSAVWRLKRIFGQRKLSSGCSEHSAVRPLLRTESIGTS